MKYCTKCGAQMSDDSKFCTKCGSKLNGEPADSPAISKKSILVGVGAVLAVAVVALVIGLSRGKSSGALDVADSAMGVSEKADNDSSDQDESSEELAENVESPADDAAEAEDNVTEAEDVTAEAEGDDAEAEDNVTEAEGDAETVSPEVFEAYKNYIRTNYGDTSFFKYSMIYLDSDDIPECVVWCCSSENVDNNVCVMSYKDGEVQAYQTEGNYYCVDFSYYEKSEKFCATKINATGGSSYFQEVVQLKDSFEKLGSTAMWTEDAGSSYNFQINDKDVSDEREIMEYINNFGCSTDLTESDIFESLDLAYASIGGVVGEKQKVSICSTKEVSNSDLEQMVQKLLLAQAEEVIKAKTPLGEKADTYNPGFMRSRSGVIVEDYKYEVFGGLKSTSSLIDYTVQRAQDATYSISATCETSCIFDSDVYRYTSENCKTLYGLFHVTVSYTNPHSMKGTRSNDKYYLVMFNKSGDSYKISGFAEANERDYKYYMIETVTDADIIEKIEKVVDKSSPEYEAYQAYDKYLGEIGGYITDGTFAYIDADEYPEYVLSAGRSASLSGNAVKSNYSSHSVIFSYKGNGTVIEIHTGYNFLKDSLQDYIMVDKSRNGRVVAETNKESDGQNVFLSFSISDIKEQENGKYALTNETEGIYSVNGSGAAIFTDTEGADTNLTSYREHYFRSFACAFWDLVKNNYDVEFVTE